ncbi:hypothetical protein L2E82_29164 [Cichorium intybus]|uniref:Uncharacterized protein n=1 Tax=Cichorium intybus TaxID=13427 RepID=A0ACB9CX77_CICIN|nr:hypothetical protein L2E82_29164 [Cichorium intybus]
MNDQWRYGILAPGASRLKRKERESVYSTKRSPLAPPPPPPPSQKLPQASVATSTTVTTSKGSKAMDANATSSNKLLAGYMAYEFLTKGTLLGQKFDGARADTAARGKRQTETEANGNETYKEITSLLMMKNDGGARIPGIVNPTQLARWIQM